MVSGWLKQWLIKEFFTKLAEDGVGDRRRANFWLRYVNLIENSMQFALGAKALYSTDRDFEVLRKNMTGLYTELKGAGSSNNAFIMTLGDLVVVEFGDIGALYGYDKSKELLFDTTFPVSSAVDAWNSLRHSSRMLWMKHQDGIKGWNKWEDMFEATLKEHFDISPDAAAKRVTSRFAGTESNPAPALVSAPEQRSLLDGDKRDFSMVNLNFYAGIHGIEVDDRRKLNGNLWIRTDDRDLLVRKTLLDWGFQYKPGKGCWR